MENYSEEFKLSVGRQAFNSNEKLKDLANRFGVSQSSILVWRQMYIDERLGNPT